MRRRIGAAIGLFLLVAAPTLAQTLDDAAVGSALQAGLSKKHYSLGLVSSCVAAPGFGAGLGASMAGGVQPTGVFDVLVSRAAGRIAFLAAESKRLYKTFGLADVTPELRDDSTVLRRGAYRGAPKKTSQGTYEGHVTDRARGSQVEGRIPTPWRSLWTWS
jgi:hypothetical protein